MSNEDIEDIDLLDMLDSDVKDEANFSIGEAEKARKEEEAKKSLDSMKDLFNVVGNSGNPGSGDITEDLMLWFNGDDKLPSDPLVEFLSNAAIKAEFGMFFNMLKNFTRLKRLQEFVDRAEEAIFDPDEIITLSPEELQSRMKDASVRIKEIYELNRRTISGMKEKGKEGEMDKLKMLLSAIPSNKLKDIISSLTNNG